MEKSFMIFIIAYVIILSFLSVLIIIVNKSDNKPATSLAGNLQTIFPTPTPAVVLQMPSPSKILNNDYHIFQSFNNCGPAALSMALSYYGINESQQVLGQALRPFQNPQGDNDDKSVTLEELAEKSKDYGFVPYHRPNGNSELIKLFITYDIPVVTRTWLKVNEDIGHYRVVKGYDDTTREFIQDDSLQGKNLRYSYDDFNVLWEKFDYEYLVLIPKEKEEIVKEILGEDLDFKKSWEKALNNSTFSFSKSVALYNLGRYQESVNEFEKVENSLSFRTLWYQIEPIKAYYELGNYERVFAITDKILNTYNRAFSELYIIRGNIYLKQGNLEAAKSEFEKAVFYNINLKSAQEALQSLL